MRALHQSLLARLPLLTLILCGPVGAVGAATSTPSDTAALSGADAAAIRKAAGANNLPDLYKALFAAIAAAPDRLAEVVRDATSLAPALQDPIVRTVDSAFPGRLQQPRQAEAQAGPAEAEAQPGAPVENKPEPEPSPWSGEIAAAAGIATGNSPLDTINLETTVAYTTGAWEHEASLDYILSRDSQTTSANRLELEYSPSYHFDERLFALGLGRFVRDRSEDFQFTGIEAVGPGYEAIKTDDMTLSVAVGPGLRQEKERKRDGGRLRNEPVGVTTSQFAWNLTHRLQFTNGATLVGNTAATWIDTTSALTLKFDEHFSGRLSYSIRHNTNPPGDDNKTDTLTRAAIVYGFGE